VYRVIAKLIHTSSNPQCTQGASQHHHQQRKRLTAVRAFYKHAQQTPHSAVQRTSIISNPIAQQSTPSVTPAQYTMHPITACASSPFHCDTEEELAWKKTKP